MAKHGHQPQPGPPPSQPSSVSGARPAAAELPLASAPKPALCRMVLVKTTGAIRGRTEHAAMITGVHSDTLIDVTLNPSGEPPYPVTAVPHVDSAPQAAITWRWPPRT